MKESHVAPCVKILCFFYMPEGKFQVKAASEVKIQIKKWGSWNSVIRGQRKSSESRTWWGHIGMDDMWRFELCQSVNKIFCYARYENCRAKTTDILTNVLNISDSYCTINSIYYYYYQKLFSNPEFCCVPEIKNNREKYNTNAMLRNIDGEHCRFDNITHRSVFNTSIDYWIYVEVVIYIYCKPQNLKPEVIHIIHIIV